MRCFTVALLLAAAGPACSGSGEPPSDPAEPSTEPIVDDPPAPPAQPAPPALVQAVVTGYRIVPSDAERGDDGRGRLVPATDAVAIEVEAARWPARALDPVLHVGQLRLRHYDHPSPTTLRFVVADVGVLPEGAQVAVQYGDDAASRVVVTDSLAVTR